MRRLFFIFVLSAVLSCLKENGSPKGVTLFGGMTLLEEVCAVEMVFKVSDML